MDWKELSYQTEFELDGEPRPVTGHTDGANVTAAHTFKGAFFTQIMLKKIYETGKHRQKVYIVSSTETLSFFLQLSQSLVETARTLCMHFKVARNIVCYDFLNFSRKPLCERISLFYSIFINEFERFIKALHN